MIVFVVPQQGSPSIMSYLDSWGRTLVDRMQVIFYEDLPHRKTLPVGTYVFSGLDVLSPTQTEIATQLAEQLSRFGKGVRLLNHPGRAMRRYELLRALYESGRNRFRAIRASQSLTSLRFPVFLREEQRHNGSRTKLLQAPEELERALVSLVIRGYRPSELLAVEYCDTSDKNGIYRKYSAYIVGGRIIPRCVNFCRSFMVKHDIHAYTSEAAREEREYMDENPDEPWLREVFDLAQIGYGRIDYSFRGDEPQIWEININPTIGRIGPPRKRPPSIEKIRQLRSEAREQFYSRFLSAWQAVDSQHVSSQEIAIAIEPRMLRKLKVEERKRRRAVAPRILIGKLSKKPTFQMLKRLLEPAVLSLTPLLMRIRGSRRAGSY